VSGGGHRLILNIL